MHANTAAPRKKREIPLISPAKVESAAQLIKSHVRGGGRRPKSVSLHKVCTINRCQLDDIIQFVKIQTPEDEEDETEEDGGSSVASEHSIKLRNQLDCTTGINGVGEHLKEVSGRHKTQMRLSTTARTAGLTYG